MKTDHILFIASGAFHVAKPSDLLPELQGRLPIRVELKALTEEDFVRILSDTRASLTEQYRALLATEGVTIDFAEDGIRALARIAAEVNAQVENIGARRLQTVLEKLLEDVSFEAEERKGESADRRRRLCRQAARRDRPRHRPQQIRALTPSFFLCSQIAARLRRLADKGGRDADRGLPLRRDPLRGGGRARPRRALPLHRLPPQLPARRWSAGPCSAMTISGSRRARPWSTPRPSMAGAISARPAAPACSTPTIRSSRTRPTSSRRRSTHRRRCRPGAHIQVAERIAWMKDAGSLPAFERYPGME